MKGNIVKKNKCSYCRESVYKDKVHKIKYIYQKKYKN